ncbi:hypothetical protein J6P11_03045 [bacterium]|nr:hypothetical protein [bacterium]
MKLDKNEKQIYVNKYDYMHYFTRCNPVQFLTNAQVENIISNQTNELKNSDKLDLVEDNTDFFEKEINENDDLRQNQLNGNNQTSADIDNNETQLIEGKIVDK